jgi:hypothetical protein
LVDGMAAYNKGKELDYELRRRSSSERTEARDSND